MDNPDVNRAIEYALCRLETDLPPQLAYHSIAHTRDDVVPAAERLAAMEGVNGDQLALLRTAAYFHDLGYIEQRDDHEFVSMRIAAAVLPQFGYTAEQVDKIKGMILATRLPQSPRCLLERILADADLDALGREDFFVVNVALREELATYGQPMTDEEWYRNQLRFVESHAYFTDAARSLRGETKRRNLETLRRLLHSLPV